LRKHFLISSLLVLVLGLILSGCAGNETNTKKEKIDTKEVQQMSAYIGTDACITCHSETGQGFAMTSHAGIFKSLDQYNTDFKQMVNVWDGATKENPATKAINLEDTYGVMMDSYVVGNIDGFSQELYRVASLEKSEQGYELVAASLKDYNSDGIQDWSAKAYSCAECHSPGLVAQGLGIKNLEPGISCETCHGPGSIHAQTKRKEAISINQNACITCHTLGQPSETEDGSSLIAENHYGTRNWFASDHYTSGYVNCLSCHTSHEVNKEGSMLKGDNFTENCASCHKDENFDIEEIMWKNPTDLHDHVTRDHSFGAIPYEKIGDNPETKEVEITDPKIIKKLKSLIK